MSPSDKVIYRALSAAAEAAAPCPTNVELARLAGYKEPISAANSIRRMQREGRVKSVKIPTGRIVIIIETGKTCQSAGVPTEEPYEPPVKKQVVILPPRQFRDPCPRCGVRGDVGCRHGWTGETFLGLAM